MRKGNLLASITVLMSRLLMIPHVKPASISSNSGWELLDDGTLVIHSDIHGVPWASYRTSICTLILTAALLPLAIMFSIIVST